MASASESLSPCSLLASVKSPFPAALVQMRRNYLFVVLLAGFTVGPHPGGICGSARGLEPHASPDDFRNCYQRIEIGQTPSTMVLGSPSRATMIPCIQRPAPIIAFSSLRL